MNPIYLDYNATTPIDKEVAEAMKPYLEEYFGNPSSTHSYGSKTKMAVERSRQQVAELINCDPSEIIFTSGGTESNNYAIKGIALSQKQKGKHIITSSIEHPAVIEVCKYLEKQDFEVTYLPVDEHGIIRLDELRNAIRNDTILISIMHANNEVGSIQPVNDIGRIAKEHGIIFHCDAAQSIGKIQVDVKLMGAHLLSIAGHKLYAPKGIGALYVKNGVTLEKLMHGANHEQNLRAGTENVLEIVGLGKAAEICKRDLEKNQKHFAQTRDLLWKNFQTSIADIRRNGHPEKVLPNTLSVSFRKVEANTLVSRLSGVAASAGAACHAESIDISDVLRAMSVPMDYAMGTVRFSTGRQTNLNEIEQASKEIAETVKSLMPSNDDSGAIAKSSEEIKLTQYTHGLGCACKIEPQKLEEVLKKLTVLTNKNVLIGTENSDDAAVYQLSDDIALVQTLDFFTPIVDNPFDFGAIAAANALSDIYAMGATPIFALNIVGFPEKTLPLSVLEQILLGAQSKANEAGIPILGGHTIEDPEPKYGMVASGTVHPKKVVSNKGAQPGDALILTKPIGTGILSTAVKRGVATEDVAKFMIKLMSTLNKRAAELFANHKVNACTDVTGFGLLGHLHEMTSASGVCATIDFKKVPFIDEAKNLASAGVIPGGTHKNLSFMESKVDFEGLSQTQKLLISDAQTSGGLLIAIPKSMANNYCQEFNSQSEFEATIIGQITSKGDGRIRVVATT